MILQQNIHCRSEGRGFYELTSQVEGMVESAGIDTGICNVFCEHTSASLILCENADSEVLRDLERFMSKLVVDGAPMFRHTAEGKDDMPAHVRSVLTTNSISIPIKQGRLHTGTWQGIYLWEHRTGSARNRNITITLTG